jgi:hypothetical protein
MRGHDNTETTDETESSEKAALWRVFFCAVVATLCNIAFGCVRPPVHLLFAQHTCIDPAALLPSPLRPLALFASLAGCNSCALAEPTLT